tara:strand:+ start:145 stop:381 length:237 start_codon:yes stop_codon:yes gene_type:complete
MLGTKEDVMELENNIDEYIFFQFLSAYQDLLTELSSKYGKETHDVLMQYLEYKHNEAVQNAFQERGMNNGLPIHKVIT